MSGPWRRDFDTARDPYAARNALGITSTGGGGGGGAPVDAQYIVAADDPTLTNDRVLTNTATVTWDFSTAGQAKANAVASGTDTEAVQDIVGALIVDSTHLNWTYNDTLGQLSANIYGSSVTNSSLAFMADSTIKGRIAGSGSGNPVDLTPAQALTAIGAQPAGSYQPLDADLTAIAALTGTDTIYYRSGTNTWSAVNVSTGLAFSSGNLTATGGAGAATVTVPQGRLTLDAAAPVMTTTQAAKTTIYYLPFAGELVPIYDGATWTMTSIGAMIVASTTDTTKNPAAVGASQVLDWFIWSDSGTLRLSHGPAWTNDTTRSAGTAIARVNGIWVNSATITNACAAQRGTYVGTTRSNASSQIDWILGGAASGGVAARLDVWNCYNRIRTVAKSSDNGAQYTYSSATIRQARASANNQAAFVCGLVEDVVEVGYISQVITVAVAGAYVSWGIGLDTTTVFSTRGYISASGSGSNQGFAGTVNYYSTGHSIGWHTLNALEASDGTNANTFGSTAGFNSFNLTVFS